MGKLSIKDLINLRDGKVPFYNSPEIMAERIIDYFNGGYPTRKKRVKVGRDEYEEQEIPAPSLSSLAFFLGFKDKGSLYSYEKKSEEFGYLIGRARTLIEMEYEKLLHDNPTAAIFALKNFGWSDNGGGNEEKEKALPNKIIIEHVMVDKRKNKDEIIEGEVDVGGVLEDKKEVNKDDESIDFNINFS